jgi:hypothetical protein
MQTKRIWGNGQPSDVQASSWLMSATSARAAFFRHSVGVFLTIATAAAPFPALAVLFGTGSNGTVFTEAGTETDDNSYGEESYCALSSHTTGSSCSTGGTLIGYASDGDPYSVSASSNAGLGGSVQATINEGGSDAVYATATAATGDILTFSGNKAGEFGTLTATGSGTASNSGFASLEAEVDVSGNWGPDTGYYWEGAGVVSETNSTIGSSCTTYQDIERDNGYIVGSVGGLTQCVSAVKGLLTLSIEFPLDPSVVAGGLGISIALQESTNGDGNVSYSDPVTLTLPAGVSFVSQAGQDYTLPPAGVPEPSTLLIYANGLLGLACVSLTRRVIPRSRAMANASGAERVFERA